MQHSRVLEVLVAATVGGLAAPVMAQDVTDSSPPLPAASYAGTYRNDFVGTAVVAEEGGKLVLKLGPRLRAFPLAHFDRDTFTYQPEGEMAAGPSGVTFRIGPDRVADVVTIENLDVHGSGTLTRVPAKR